MNHQEQELSDAQIKDVVCKLRKRNRDGKVSPHKPLLLMLMLGHYWNNGNRLVLFRSAAIPLWGMLKEFSNESSHPRVGTLSPFTNMEKAIWDRTHPEITKDHYRKAFLAGMMGGFTETLYRRVINDKAFIFELAALIHEKHLGGMDFKGLLHSVNIPNADQSKPGTLDGLSVESDLIPAGSGCTICGYRGSVGKHWSVGISRTHVKWPVAGGPSHVPSNILYMCDLHKILFDCGAFTLDQRRHKLIVSNSYKGQFSEQEDLADPDSPDRIKPEYLKWHKRVVFSQN